MMDVRWDPGLWRALVWEHGAALLSPDVPLEQAEALWEAVAQSSRLGTFLQTLASGCGTGLLDLPPFAVVLFEQEVAHLAVRGDLTITDPMTGDESSGSSVTTWIERQVARPEALLLQTDASVAGLLPLRDGIVLASGLTIGRSACRTDLSAERAGPLPTWDEPEREPAPEAEMKDNQESAAMDAASWEPSSLLDPLPSAEPNGLEWVGPAPSDDELQRVWSSAPQSAVPPIDHEVTLLEPEHVDGSGPQPVAVEEGRHAVAGTPGVEAASAALEAGDHSVTSPQAENPVVRGGSPVTSPVVAPAVSLGVGDHDGHTVLGDDEDLLPGHLPTSTLGVDVPTVLAAFCNNDHANPTHRESCHECGSPVGSRTERVARPSLGRLRVSSGEVYDLTGPIVAGRSPSAAASRGGEMARLLALPHTHVSGNHLEIRLQDWTVSAVDLHSTNGTYLRRQGQPPVRLPETPMPLTDSDVLDLGHGVFLYLENLP